jgi:DNA-binding NarL/FixJ family response regulator
MNNIVIIASTAGFLVDTLRDLLRDIGYKTVVACNEIDLIQKIKVAFPRYVFLEHCFMKNATDEYIQKIIKSYHNLHVVMWTASELTADAAARFIFAGAESFFSLREKCENVENIFNRFLMGKTYCPADVEAVLVNEKSIPIIGIPLTDREIQIIKLIDKSDKAIACILSITVNTVYFHKTNIYKKLGITCKRELVSYANKNNFISNLEVR